MKQLSQYRSTGLELFDFFHVSWPKYSSTIMNVKKRQKEHGLQYILLIIPTWITRKTDSSAVAHISCTHNEQFKKMSWNIFMNYENINNAAQVGV
jgi:hypothetical protein